MSSRPATALTLVRDEGFAEAPSPSTLRCAAGDLAPLPAPERHPVLVVESDDEVARTLLEHLACDGYPTEHARSTGHARLLARSCEPRLIVLGQLGAPRAALDLLEEIRGSACPSAPCAPQTPVVILREGPSELGMVRAFEAGADDFVFRSGHYLELRLRIQALLRRAEQTPARTRLLKVGPLEVDPDRHAVRMHGRPVSLRRLEFELLAHLAADPERVFTKHELLRAVWGYRSHGSTRTVDSHASRLRRKLEPHGSSWVINVWGVGYRLH